MIKQVAKLMLKNKDVELTHFSELNKKFDVLFQANHEFIGRVLKCHLIIEKYLNDCLEFFYGKDSIESANLRFYQKLVLLKNTAPSMKMAFIGVQEINQIRNRFAHKLNTRITISDVKSCKPLVDTFLGESVRDPARIIEVFTSIVCVWLADDISDIGTKRKRQIAKLVAKKVK